ncbi:DUF6090 family protein [Geojedonia litorea]|uniref:DUF6090 family protein n=1 Tax=Geojedonia litorea TaxID=1268269 RepID=A0ABV9N6T9_9FLAO
MIKENKVSKYLLYAIGEIVLVVIGILIALQVNNWNESRKLKETEREFFQGVRSDLLQDKAYMNHIIEKANIKITAYKMFSKDLPNLYETNRPKLDSLLNIYFALGGTFYPISGSFNSAMSSNEFNTFKNKPLKMMVIKLYNSTYARLMDNAKDVDNRWFYVIKKYSRVRRTGNLGNFIQDQLEEFEDDVFYHIYGLEYYIGNLKSAIEEIDAFLENEQNAWD